CLGEHGLAHAGDVLDEDVAPAEKREDAQLDLCILADYHGADALDQPVDEVAHPCRHPDFLPFAVERSTTFGQYTSRSSGPQKACCATRGPHSTRPSGPPARWGGGKNRGERDKRAKVPVHR